MTIQPTVFNLLFYVVVLIAGLDFTLSGWFALRNGEVVLESHKLLGVRILRSLNNLYENSLHSKRIYELMYSFRYMRVYTFISGILLVFIGLALILDILFQQSI